MRRRRVNARCICQERERALSREVSNERFVGCLRRATIGVNGCVALGHRIEQRPRKPTRTELCMASAARQRANPSMHRTCYGWLRQPPPAGDLKR